MEWHHEPETIALLDALDRMGSARHRPETPVRTCSRCGSRRVAFDHRRRVELCDDCGAEGDILDPIT